MKKIFTLNIFVWFKVIGFLLLLPCLSYAQLAPFQNYLAGSDKGLEANFTLEDSQNNIQQLHKAIVYNTAPLDIDWDWKALFEEPDHFESRSSTLQIGLGLLTTVDLKDRSNELNQLDAKLFIPALHLLYEHEVWKNVGVGLSLGTQIWKVPVLDYQYRYSTIGLRTTYHINLVEKIDPYVALGSSFRIISLTNTDRNIANSKLTFHMILGTRYYFNDWLGAYLEIGNDTTSLIKLGLSFYFS